MPDLTPAPAEVVEDHDDLGAALEANYDALVEGDPTASPSAGTSPAQPPIEGAGGEAARARDPASGRFTKAEREAQAAAAAVVNTEFKVPEKWPADVRAELEAMYKINPAHAEWNLKQYAFFRGEAARHVQHHEKRVEKLATTQKQIEDLLGPGRQQRALQGLDDTSYIRNLVAAGDILDKNPVEGLKWLAKRYGVDLGNLEQQGGGAPAIPPEVQRVMQENAEIKAMLLRGQQEQTQQQTEQQLYMASDWINQFAAQKDPQGQALYPHFDDVINEIIVNVQYQMQSGQQVDVKAAYDRAIRMNDSVWLKEQQRTSKASESTRKREIEEARRAGLSVSGSGASSMESVPDDLGAHLERNYDRFIS